MQNQNDMNPLQLIYTIASTVAFYVVFARMKAYEARLTRLENQRKPEPEKPVRAPVPPKQIFEKPIVKNAKEVKPLEIGDGRMRFDAEAQIAEWIWIGGTFMIWVKYLVVDL